MKDPQPPTVSSSPPVGEEDFRLAREYTIDYYGDPDEFPSVMNSYLRGLREGRALSASRLAQAEGQLLAVTEQAIAAEKEILSQLAAAQARIAELEKRLLAVDKQAAECQDRYQRLLTALEGLVRDLEFAAGVNDEQSPELKRAHKQYKNAAEWAQAALEKGRGDAE